MITEIEPASHRVRLTDALRLSSLLPVSLPDLGPLASVAQEVAFEWNVELGPPFAFSRYSFVAPAGENAVLKVTPPDDDESDEEADALLSGLERGLFDSCAEIRSGGPC